MTQLWAPSQERANNSNLQRFQDFLAKRGRVTANYEELHTFSINDQESFYEAFWDFAQIKGQKGKQIYLNEGHMREAKYFPTGTLSYAENLLFPTSQKAATALLLDREKGEPEEMSWTDLRELVARYQALFIKVGIKLGDRIAAMVPNGADAIAILAAANGLGAITATCSPDFGLEGALDRFGQIKPKIFISAKSYIYAGQKVEIQSKARALAKRLENLKLHFEFDFVNSQPRDLPKSGELVLKQLPFDHPLYILFSSGTTGKPKCIVHRQGGALVKHLLEHILHCDSKAGDRTFFFTTCGWMMWNWLVSGLANSQTLQLYDGSPFHPRPKVLWDLVDRNRLNFFGCGAKYIDAMSKSSYVPIEKANLTSLQTIATTGSPLIHESFDYVYEKIKRNVCLSSISGGTDIIGCFVGGQPNSPVYRGEIQGPILGMDVRIFDSTGKKTKVGEQGELVCASPFPSMPLNFWNDVDDKKYLGAYFEEFENVWHHGDYIELTSNGGYIIHGRSDATLNPGGVRIGTAEIYRQVEPLKEIEEAVVVGQPKAGDVRVVLFLKMSNGYKLTPELIALIKSRIKENASPRHVPTIVAEVADIPKTRSGKISELAVRDVISGIEIKNAGALANAESLALFVPALNAAQI